MPYPQKSVNWKFLHAPGEKPDKDTLFIGVELELEDTEGPPDGARYDRVYTRLESLAKCFDESNPSLWQYGDDGSLHFGVEFKTNPFTYQYYAQGQMNLTTLFGSIKGKAAPFAWDNKEYTAGVHIHMSRAGFTTEHLERFIKFHYNNKALCQLVAGRESEAYASFNMGKNKGYVYSPDRTIRVETDDETISKLAKGESHGHTRYMAVNMQPRNTIELRYFVSTARQKRFQGYIEWAFALYEYTKNPDNALSGADFKHWLSDKLQYENAYKLTQRRLTVEKPKGVVVDKVEAFMPGNFRGYRRA